MPDNALLNIDATLHDTSTWCEVNVNACDTTQSAREGPMTVVERQEPATEGDENRKCARPAAVPISTLGFVLNDRIEVSWEVEMTDGSEEAVWWTATIVSLGGDEGGEGDPVLEYEAQHGFTSERRRVVFSSESVLWDAVLKENLDWR